MAIAVTLSQQGRQYILWRIRNTHPPPLKCYSSIEYSIWKGTLCPSGKTTNSKSCPIELHIEKQKLNKRHFFIIFQLVKKIVPGG